VKRVAIIGLGMAVGPHAKSLLDLAGRVEAVAACSPTPARRTAFADTYGLPVSGDIDAIFADRHAWHRAAGRSDGIGAAA
jgi:predicted dehydrogenase